MNELLKEKKSFVEMEEFDNHKLISFFYDEKSGLEGFIALHRVNPEVPSFGATRLCLYESSVEGLKDALRLSRLMSYKAALAGLNCGGGKAVIIENTKKIHNKKDRERLFAQYAQKVNLLGGRFVTGTDVGVSQSDLFTMKTYAPSSIVGFNDNSTKFTALGIFESIKVCLKEVFDSTDLQGKKIAIQGVGKVGEELLNMIYKEVGDNGKIYITDVNQKLLKDMQVKYPKVICVHPEDIHKQLVDVYCPCALSNSLNSKTIYSLHTRIIVGSANNQLENEEIGDLLYKLGILYAPDYVVNAGGLIGVFDEYKNKKYDYKQVCSRVLKISETLSDILIKSHKQHKATNRVANEMAEKIFNAYE